MGLGGYSLTEDEREFLLFHHNPPPVTHYVVTTPSRMGEVVQLVAVKGDDERALTRSIPFADFQGLSAFFSPDMTVDLELVMSAPVVRKETADAD